MYIRCPSCKSSTWVAGKDGRVLPRVACKRCRAPHDLQGIDDVGRTAKERHARAVEFADRFGVDLASAYSILLGLMPEPGDPEPSPGEEPVATESNDAAAVHYDPGFRKAVADGLLTPEEARDQGDRNSAAGRLAKRHGLPVELALEVVDRRISLLEAANRAPRVQTQVKAVPATGREKIMVTGFAALVFIAIAIFGLNRWAVLEGQARMAEARSAEAQQVAAAAVEPTKTVAKAEVPALVDTDDRGRPLRVSGRSPEAVLDAFCSAGGTGRYRGEQIAPSANGARLGILRDLDNLEEKLAILIRRDRSTGRWFAGSGLEPIVVAPAPAL